MTKRGQAKLLDFGLAKLLLGNRNGTSESALKTADEHAMISAYPFTRLELWLLVPPEQVRAEELDPRTDLFAFGSVLYEMATGGVAFPGNSSSGIISEAILNRTPPPPSSANPAIPAQLEEVIFKALEKRARVPLSDSRRAARQPESGSSAASTRHECGQGAGLHRHLER